MFKKFENKLMYWETALLLALSVTLLLGAWAEKTQTDLTDKLIRLHVLAESDAATEQAVKLQVRDAVLACVQPMLTETKTRAAAAEILEAALPQIEDAARSAAKGRAVTVTLGEENYPTRYYTDFALPAGRYTSLRVTLGSGAGQNWWCVVFPPLCGAAGLAEAEVQCLSDDQLAIIGETEAGYVLKFRILELWGELMNKFDGHAW